MPYAKTFAGVVIFVIVLWAVNLVVPLLLFAKSNERGLHGDMFGAVNALFSGLAFAGVIYAILLQRKELQYQRRELRHTVEQLKGQRDQLEAQNRTFMQQTFENSFFQMLTLHHSHVELVSAIASTATPSAITSETSTTL